MEGAADETELQASEVIATNSHATARTFEAIARGREATTPVVPRDQRARKIS